MRKLWVCTLTLCLGFASTSHASSVSKFQFSGNTAGGGIGTVDAECFNAYFFVQASDSVIKEGSSTTVTKELLFNFFAVDNCLALSYSSFAVVPLTTSLLNKSTVTFPFDILVDVTPFDSYDVTGQKRLVGTVTITATGELQKSRQDDITQSEASRQVVRSKGTTRDASITATAKFDGVQVNFAADSGSAEMGTTKTGSMEITRY